MDMLIYCLVLLFLIIMGANIAFSLALSSLFYVVFFSTLDPIIIPQKMISSLDSFILLAVPCFVFLGEVMRLSKITDRLVSLANALVGHIRGGLAQVNIVTSMLMSGIQGAATADAAAVGSILIPAMKKDGYSASFSAALTSASSAIGPIIPPSLSAVVYGWMGEVSIGRLFLGGAIPGIMLGLYLMAYAYYISRREGYGGRLATRFSVTRLQNGLKSGFLPLLIPLIIVGGIVGGVFTPTESAAIAVLVAVILGGFVYRELGWKELGECFLNTIRLMGSILLILACASTFGWILTIQGGSQILAHALLHISKNPLVVMLILNAILLIIGCFIDPMPILIMLTPIILPVAVAVGYDPVHFGIIMILNLTIGLSTPPLGLTMFVSCAIAEISVEEFMRPMLPLYIPLLLGLLTVILFPQIVMFLPNLLMPLR